MDFLVRLKCGEFHKISTRAPELSGRCDGVVLISLTRNGGYISSVTPDVSVDWRRSSGGAGKKTPESRCSQRGEKSHWGKCKVRFRRLKRFKKMDIKYTDCAIPKSQTKWTWPVHNWHKFAPNPRESGQYWASAGIQQRAGQSSTWEWWRRWSFWCSPTRNVNTIFADTNFFHCRIPFSRSSTGLFIRFKKIMSKLRLSARVSPISTPLIASREFDEFLRAYQISDRDKWSFANYLVTREGEALVRYSWAGKNLCP